MGEIVRRLDIEGLSPIDNLVIQANNHSRDENTNDTFEKRRALGAGSSMSESARKANVDRSGEENRRVRIRTATQEDAPTIAILGADIQEMHHRSRPDWFKPADAQESAALYEELLANPSVSTFIAEDGAEALGFVLVKVHHRAETPLNCAQVVVDIDQIGVTPSARGRGVGHELMVSVRDLANQVSADRILLTTWEFNTDAHRFFESEGLTTEMRRMSMSWPRPE